MGGIRLRQINEALGYDKAMNAMVWNLENKNVAANPDPLSTPYSQIDAQMLKAVDQAAGQLKAAIEAKHASLSPMVRPGSSVMSAGFCAGAGHFSDSGHY